MYELLIVDDETLAQIGIKSLLDFNELGIEVAGSASNGMAAWEFIRSHEPQIVITDIKMPVMDGLELVECCNKNMERPPKFIILTGFEEFEYVRRAMRSNVVDYIIKVELTAEILRKTLEKTVEQLEEAGARGVEDRYAYDILLNRTLTQLLSRAFSVEKEIASKLEEFDLDLAGDTFVAVALEVDPHALDLPEYRDRHKLFLAVMNTAKTILPKYCKGCVTAYSSSLIGLLLCFGGEENWRETCRKLLEHIGGLGSKYFNIVLRFGVGQPEESLYRVSSSFGNARRALAGTDEAAPIAYFLPSEGEEDRQAVDYSEIFEDIAGSFENFDAGLFSNTADRICAAILDTSVRMETAIDLVSGIIHNIISNLDYGKQMLENTFAWSSVSYRVVYGCTERQELVEYLRQIQKDVVEKLEEYQQCPKNRLIIAAQNYIREHISEKLTLSVVAGAIGVTPNYLSSIFKKYCHYGFSDYVTFMKIRRAQDLLVKSNLKVYQVAEKLGFDSSYYFSTVYKKFTGFSPKETASMHRLWDNTRAGEGGGYTVH